MSRVVQKFDDDYGDSDDVGSISSSSSETSKNSIISLTYYCNCGGYCKNEKASLARHYKTKRHQAYILENPEEDD